jgi:proteasome lid subunit RPN8/RPN11
MKSAFCATKTKPKKPNRKPSSRRKHRRSNRPAIRFTPYAWAKLLYLRDAGDTEIGGFAVTSPNDLLLVEDVCLVRQQCTAITVEFDDESVADFYDEQVDAGLKPEQFGRIWLHTHPGTSSEPSLTDEETFDRCFGSVEWAVMFILAKGGETYARLRFNVGPQSTQEINVEIVYSSPFEGSNNFEWKREFDANVQKLRWRDSSSRLTDAAYGSLGCDPFSEADEQPFESFGAELNRDDEDWLNRLNADPLFLVWENDECETLLSTIPG